MTETKTKQPPPGRDAKSGRFVKGNKLSLGNPFARKAAEMRQAIYAAISAEDMRRVIATLKEQAIAGDLKAIALLLDRVLGTAQAGIDLLEKIERLEAALLQTDSGKDVLQ